MAELYEIVYYTSWNGRMIYWPADWRPDVLAEKLTEAQEFGLVTARSRPLPSTSSRSN